MLPVMRDVPPGSDRTAVHRQRRLSCWIALGCCFVGSECNGCLHQYRSCGPRVDGVQLPLPGGWRQLHVSVPACERTCSPPPLLVHNASETGPVRGNGRTHEFNSQAMDCR